MKSLSFILFAIFLFSGCATWHGIKQDFSDAGDWTKSKVNQGASYVKEKTD